MMTFYLIGSLISVICFIIGDRCDDEKQGFIQNQNTMMLLAAFLSWLGLIGTIIFWLEERRKQNDEN